MLKRFVENDKHKEDYKYDCFAAYITEEPYQLQLHKARSLAVTNLEKAISLNPSGKESQYRREALAAVRAEKIYGWHWCAD